MNSDYRSESSLEEEVEFYIDENTLQSIIKFQALVRGYLTRKLVFEHLQRIAEQNGYEVDENEEEAELNQMVLRASDINRFN